VTSADLIRWSTLHDKRARSGAAFAFVWLAGAALAGWVWWRGQPAPPSYDVSAAFASGSHAWLAGTLAAYAFAFMRVPFHLYWRADAALLAQLPIEGGPLLDAALWRCVKSALWTTVAVVIGAAPLAQYSTELFVRHLAVAGALGLAAALFLPAVAVWAASLVAVSQGERVQALRVATGIDRERRQSTTVQPPAPSTAALGAFPGFASSLLIVGILISSSWLTGGSPNVPMPIVLASIGGVSLVSILATRATAPRVMGTILRDVSALDRQRLAMLEIHPPSAIERLIARLIGVAALPYSKDARLMRRRYPMAYALGALIFIVLVIVGIARPADPTPWLTATLVGAALYGVSLSGRLHRAPIELPKLSATLPISARSRRLAKLAWIVGWWTIFVLAPALFSALRQPAPLPGLALVGGGTLAVLMAALVR
jgi:hypothetical protein